MPATTLSVILSNFNHGHVLARAVEAIMGQSRPPDEFILVDDGSTDDSLKRIEALSRTYPGLIILRNELNRGANAGYALGLRQARGRYAYLAAADDYLLPDLFERSLELLETHPEASLCSALTLIENDDGRIVGPMPTPKVLDAPGFISPRRAKELLLRHGEWIRCNTAVYRLEPLRALGGFDPRLGSYGDAFTCMLFAVRDGVCFIPAPGGVMRASDDSLSARSVSDAGTAAEMFSYAGNLMTTTYGRFFDPGLVARWDGRWRYAVARNVIRRHGAAGARDVAGLLPGAGGLDKATIAALGRLRLLDGRLGSFYLGIRLVPHDLLRAASARFFGRGG